MKNLISKRELITTREATPSDLNFILVHWLRGYYQDNAFVKKIKYKTYYENYEKVVKALLARSEVKIAALKESPDVILAFSVVNRDVLHFAYTKPLWRKIGLMRDLTSGYKIKTVTHLTNIFEPIAKRKHFIFNPFL